VFEIVLPWDAYDPNAKRLRGVYLVPLFLFAIVPVLFLRFINRKKSQQIPFHAAVPRPYLFLFIAPLSAFVPWFLTYPHTNYLITLAPTFYLLVAILCLAALRFLEIRINFFSPGDPRETPLSEHLQLSEGKEDHSQQEPTVTKS